MLPNSVMQDLTLSKLATENNYFKITEVNTAFRIFMGVGTRLQNSAYKFYGNSNLEKQIS
jgi:hypothetical protein